MGATVDGTVRNSILFPGARVERGAEVVDSVLFFNTIVHNGARINRIVSDVNTSFGAGASIGGPKDDKEPGEGITVIGWNNHVPGDMRIGRGCTVYPKLAPDKWSTDFLPDRGVLK